MSSQKQKLQQVLTEVEEVPIRDRHDYSGDFKVPLHAYNLIRNNRRGISQDKDEFKVNLRSGIITGERIILDPTSLAYRHRQIFNSLKETIVDTIPTVLLYIDDGSHVVRNTYNLRFDEAQSDPEGLVTILQFLKLKYEDIDNDGDIASKNTGGVEEAGIYLTPEQQSAKELRKKADNAMKEQKHKDEAQKHVEEIKEDDGDEGIGL